MFEPTALFGPVGRSSTPIVKSGRVCKRMLMKSTQVAPGMSMGKLFYCVILFCRHVHMVCVLLISFTLFTMLCRITWLKGCTEMRERRTRRVGRCLEIHLPRTIAMTC